MGNVSTTFIVVAALWILALWILSRRLPRPMALDIANTGLLVYFIVVSAINGEFSVMHLIG